MIIGANKRNNFYYIGIYKTLKLYSKQTPSQVFSSESWTTLKNTSFVRASANCYFKCE